MNHPESSVRTLFAEALELSNPEERAAYLDRVTAGDARLRRRLETLLAADSDAGGFLRVPEPGAPDPSAAPSDLPRIGPYRLVESLGEGGCGTVYLAEQERPLRRRVALKVIKLGMDTVAVVARFQLERQALALMDHPGIAKVHDAGTTGAPGSEIVDPTGRLTPGRPYFVMEWVQGPRLTDYCDEHRLAPPERLELFIQVCRAVQHAHQKGIIHRDLKPSNILVSSADGKPVPKVIDFGIAKATKDQRLADHTLFTAVDQFLGTPAYMSPEQAGLAGEDTDTRSDIYSLGVLLYELLVGRTPFDARELMKSGFDEMRRTIREREPARPSTRLTTLSEAELAEVARRRGCEPPRMPHLLRGDLDWIVMKCLEKDRSRRYETANGLAADLRRYLDNEPVVARPPTNAYRFRKLVRRNKLAFSAALGVGIAMSCATAVSIWQAAVAKQATMRAVASAEESRHLLYTADMELAHAAWVSGNFPRARTLLEQHRSDGKRDLRGFEWRLLHHLSRPREEFELRCDHPIYGSAISHDGRYLATGGGKVALWSLGDRTNLIQLQPEGWPFYSLAFSPDDRLLAASPCQDDKPFVYLWEIPGGRLSDTLIGHSKKVFSLAFSHDGRWIASSAGHAYDTNSPGEIIVWNASSRQKAKVLQGHGGTSTGFLSFSPVGDLLATPHGNGTISLWEVTSGRILRTLRGHSRLVIASAFSPDGLKLVTGGIDGTVRLWDVQSGNIEAIAIHGQHMPVYSVRFSPRGDLVASGGLDHSTRLWTKGLEPAGALFGHADRVFSVNFFPDGNQIASASVDGTVKFYRVPDSDDGQVFAKHQGGDLDPRVDFSPDGRWLARMTSIPTPEITFWHPSSPSIQSIADGGAFSFSPDGRHCVTIPGIKGFDVWDVTGHSLRFARSVAHDANIWSWPKFSSDGRWLATTSDDRGTNALVVWDTGTWSEVARLQVSPSPRPIAAWHFTSDSSQLIVVHGDGTTVFWRVGDWKQTRRMDHSNGTARVAFSADDRWMALANGTKVRVVSLDSEVRLDLRGEAGDVRSMAFSSDGRTLAVGSHQGLVKFWNVATWREMIALRAHATLVDSIAFSPDDTLLATISIEGLLKLWQAPAVESPDGSSTF